MEIDEPARFAALEAAQWFFQATGTAPATPAELIALSTLFEHYLTDGQSITFECQDSLRNTVRGKQP